MRKKLIIAIVVLSFVTCSIAAFAADPVMADDTNIISSLSDVKIKLYGLDEKDGEYNSLVLEINGFKKSFKWQSLTNPSFSPELLLDDINRDGEKELIIKLTTGEGTGVFIREVHVFSLKDLSEILVDNPLEIINRHVKATITPNGVDMIINGQLKKVEKGNIDTEPAGWFTNVSFSNQINYEIVKNELTAIIGVQISPTSFIGDIYITYQYRDGKYQSKTVSFKPEK